MNKPAISIIGKDKCTGCSACAAICPTNAIQMKENDEGFLEPEVNLNECNSCGICNKVCPIISFENNNTKDFICHAAWSTDKENILKSSSGGIFYEIAKMIIGENGQIAGAVLQGKRVKHILSNEPKIIEEMRGSKYIQSNTTDVFKKLVLPKDDKKTMFVGTPCQVSALKNLYKYKGKNVENLITCDLVCHGVPSYKVFDSYVENLSKDCGSIIRVNFRDKTYGWENFCMNIEFADGKKIIETHRENKFMQTFLSDIALRKSCYNCPFSKIPRAGDITLGDFWNAPECLKNDEGTSLVIANNAKGRRLLEILSQQNKIKLIEVDIDVIKNSNRSVVSGKRILPLKRKKFLKEIKLENFERIYQSTVIPFIKRKKYWQRIKSIKGIFSRPHPIGLPVSKSKVGILRFPSTLNYGSMMLGENAIYYLSKLIEGANFVIISNEGNEAYTRLYQATGIKKIDIKRYTNLERKPGIILKYILDYGKGLINPWSIKTIRTLEDCRSIIMLGGDTLSEYYGLIGLLQGLLDIRSLCMAGKKVYLLGQTLGPFYSWRVPLARTILKRVDAIYLRDPKSFRYAKNRLKLGNITLSADLAFLDLPHQNESFDIERFGVKNKKYFTFVISGLWSHYCNDYKIYVEGLTEIARYLLKICKERNMHLVLMPHVWAEEDLKLLRDIVSEINDISIISINNLLLPYQARKILGSSYFVLSQRMHGAISALQMGVPTVALSYGIKYSGVIGEYLGFPELVVEINKDNFMEDIKKACGTIDYALDNLPKLVYKIKKSIDRAKRDAIKQLEDVANDILS